MPQDYLDPTGQCRRHIGPGSQHWCVKPAHHPGAPQSCALEYDPTTPEAVRHQVERWRGTGLRIFDATAQAIARRYATTSGPTAGLLRLASTGTVTPETLSAVADAFGRASSQEERDALAALASYALRHGAAEGPVRGPDNGSPPANKP